jgi:hypothetical protein
MMVVYESPRPTKLYGQTKDAVDQRGPYLPSHRCRPAIGFVRRARELEPPTNAELVRAALLGIRRQLGVKPEQKVAPTDELVELFARLLVLASVSGQRQRERSRGSDIPAMHSRHPGDIMLA